MFQVRRLGKSSRGKCPYFLEIWISQNHSVGQVERSPYVKNHINPFIPFDRTPSCYRQTQTQTDRHGDRAVAITRASIASRGYKNNISFLRQTPPPVRCCPLVCQFEYTPRRQIVAVTCRITLTPPIPPDCFPTLPNIISVFYFLVFIVTF